MNQACPVCGLPFLREAGYFLGAMYISYGLGVLTVLPVAVLLAIVVEWPLAVVLVIACVQTLASVPFFLRYSRAIWLHLDQSFDPR
jgi:heme/copper-type cytochrome/quinol oxidase subunit 4